MYKMKLDDRRHGDNKIWIDKYDNFYYGPNAEHLVCPEYLDALGKLPPFTISDLKAIFQADKTLDSSGKEIESDPIIKGGNSMWMRIQVLTVKGQPWFSCHRATCHSEISQTVLRRFGRQRNSTRHEWEVMLSEGEQNIESNN